MNRTERRRKVADAITRHIVSTVYEDTGNHVQAYALPDKRKIVVRDPKSGQEVVHEDIRFCCPEHCWHDLEQDAVSQIIDHFGYMLIKVIKLNLPPRDPGS